MRGCVCGVCLELRLLLLFEVLLNRLLALLGRPPDAGVSLHRHPDELDEQTEVLKVVNASALDYEGG